MLDQNFRTIPLNYISFWCVCMYVNLCVCMGVNLCVYARVCVWRGGIFQFRLGMVST